MKIGIGLGLGFARGVAGSAPVAATSNFTMSQIPSIDSRRIYQRTTDTGGGQGKGQGTIPITVSSATAGTCFARIRSNDGTTILQGPWQLPDITNGQTTINVTGVDARLGWFFVDLLTSGGWQLGTTEVGMGRLIAFAGQSLTVRMFGRQDGQTATYASLGVAIDPNCSILASYSEVNSYQPTIATQAWDAPADVANGTGFNAVGIGRFLALQIAASGVNCGAIGHAAGAVGLSTFVTGQANWTRLSGYISRAGGAFEAFIWGQGHTEAVGYVPPAGYGTGLSIIFAQMTAANARSYSRYVWTIPNINSSSWGTASARTRIREGARAWCAANSGTYVHMYDVSLVDTVHPTQAGTVTMAEHIHRATRAEFGLSSGLGPVPVSATRVGTTITLNFSDVGQNNLVLSGTPANRVFVFPRGRVNRQTAQSDNRFPVSTVAVASKTSLAITLANDPGDGHELDLYVYWPTDGSGTPTSDTIRDDRVDADGISVGRLVAANFTPIQVAAPVPAGAVNAPPSGFVAAVSPMNAVGTSTVFAAGASGFGNEMTGGTARSPNNTGSEFCPFTVEGWFVCPTISASLQDICAFGGRVLVDTAGKLRYTAHEIGAPLLIGATTLIAGRRYHFACQSGPNGHAIYLTDITGGGSGVRDAFNATAASYPAINKTYDIRNCRGGTPMSGGAVDEIALFNAERYSGASYTAPTVPFTGAEANIQALYHLDETTGATSLAESVGA